MHLTEGEKEIRTVKPHPLSFINYHALWLIPFIWGILLIWIYGNLGRNILSNFLAIVIWIGGLAVIGIIASFLAIKWRIFILYMVLAITGLAIMWKYDLWNMCKIFIPLYNSIFLIGIPFVEIYRLSHKYVITDMRIIMEGGIIKKNRRILTYDKITDLSGEQSLLGRLFNFGNIIPITQSGFGLGEYAAFIGGGAGAANKKAGLFAFAGAKKGVEEPRARSYHELHGVHPYKEVMAEIEEFVQQNSIAPYERKQVELQQRMLDLMKKEKEEERE